MLHRKFVAHEPHIHKVAHCRGGGQNPSACQQDMERWDEEEAPSPRYDPAQAIRSDNDPPTA